MTIPTFLIHFPNDIVRNLIAPSAPTITKSKKDWKMNTNNNKEHVFMYYENIAIKHKSSVHG